MQRHIRHVAADAVPRLSAVRMMLRPVMANVAFIVVKCRSYSVLRLDEPDDR